MSRPSIQFIGFRLVETGICLALLTGCATTTTTSEQNESLSSRALRQARSSHAPEEERAAFYLQAAAMAGTHFGPTPAGTQEREIYNAASAELTALLRSTGDGRLWNRPLTLGSGETTYHLRFQPGRKDETWAPDFFTAFKPASEVSEKIIKRPDHRDGVGGTLVGIRKKTPREPFAPLVGVTAPVTATLDFKGRNVTLALGDPRKQSKTRVAGIERPLAADFSAPLAHYPAVNETIAGLMGALRGGSYMNQTGLYTLQPYDPDRIPLIFVHGLISTGGCGAMSSMNWSSIRSSVDVTSAGSSITRPAIPCSTPACVAAKN